MRKKTIIVGAGPAGLTAAYYLTNNNFPVTVLEKEKQVGGIARTIRWGKIRFDLGGHRFFTKSKEVRKIWRQILKKDFLIRPRISRIYYKNQFFYYPIRPFDTLRKLGIVESLLVLLSYIEAQIYPIEPEHSFDDWVINRFGKRLYHHFFKTYTEKLWGMPCSRIKKEWATQRIKGLSLAALILNLVKKEKLKTLIDQFHYPKYGPGQLWEQMARKIQRVNKGTIILNSEVRSILVKKNWIRQITISHKGKIKKLKVDNLISTMPLKELVEKITPQNVRAIKLAEKIKYRSFLTVALSVNKKQIFPDNWIYVHSPEVRMGRIQNYHNWSPYLVTGKDNNCLGLEYFCNNDSQDKLWNMDDKYLIKMAVREIIALGLIRKKRVKRGKVVRVPNAYPIYDQGYSQVLPDIKRELAKIKNLQTIGRAGMHRYNNMDHSMMTGILAAKNIILGKRKYDPWKVNTEDEYHEEVDAKKRK